MAYSMAPETEVSPRNAPPMMMEGVTFDANMASTCWIPSGIALAMGGV